MRRCCPAPGSKDAAARETWSNADQFPTESNSSKLVAEAWPTGGDPRHRKRDSHAGGKRTAIGERGRQASLLKKIAASSKWMMSGEPKSPRIPALSLAQALISKLNRFGHS